MAKVKIIQVFVFLGFTILFPMKSSGQEGTKPEMIINKYFDLYKNKGVDESLNYIFSTNEWLKNNSQKNIVSLKMKLKKLKSILGDFYGYEFLTKKSMGEDFVLYSYLLKYQKQPIKFIFVFYRPQKKWMIYTLKYTQNIVKELENAAKAYRLKENIDF